MPMVIHTSNRMEILLDHLAEVVRVPTGPALTPETIVVQSRGMERWISMKLAGKFGVWGNSAFPFPNKYVWDLFASTMTEVATSNVFDTDILTWRVIDQLEQLLDTPEFKELQLYLTGHSHGLKRYQLAGKIADTFDQYTLYRGDVLAEWEAGADGGWQATLWRALATGEQGFHRAKVKTEFLTRLGDGRIDLSRLPSRVLIFGLSYMPAFHMEVLAAIASYTTVHMFILSPCREYWGDIVAEKARAKQRTEFAGLTDEGNALLASLGGLGRNFSNLILDSSALFDAEQDEREEYATSAGTTLLSSLHNGILNLVNADPEHKCEVAAEDRSIAVHSCHSAMREVEVLHDQLLDMFATMDGLAPRDIIVMTPDIESYSPYISAVFSGSQDPKRRIPFTIADRSMRSEGRVGETLMAILALAGGRFTAPEVMEILAADPVCSRFGMVAGDLELIKKWLEETHISWGMSAADRTALGLPAYTEGSWLAGLERLVFGYAMSADHSVLNGEVALIDGILPFDDMEGEAATILGRFVRFVRSLHAVVADLEKPRNLAQWRETLRNLQQEFFASSKTVAREYGAIEKMIDSLATIEELSGYSREVGLDVMRSWLQKRLDNEGAGVGFLTGRVTFCAMLPMRSIPVRVVALLGMNDGSFPRQSRSPGFDIMPAAPRPGDRSLRDEDRYLFLEALLSARERLYISYTGLSIRDNSVIPSSVLVSELLDFLERGYRRGTGDFQHSLVTQHRLQPFSPAYFDGQAAGLFSYSTENLHAAGGLLRAGHQRRRFFAEPLSPPDEACRVVPLADLLKFYENPAAYIVRHRLGIRPDEKTAPLAEREVFALDNLDAYMLKKELLAHAVAGKNIGDLLPVVRAGGMLPPAGPGDKLFTGLAAETAGFAVKVIQAMAGEQFLPPLDVELTIGAFTVCGRIGDILPHQLLRYRSASFSAKDQVKVWLEHLVLNCADAAGYPKHSALIMQGGSVAVRPVAESRAYLDVLLNRYWQGLTMPLHFFPRSSLAFATKGSMSAAAAHWHNERYPESADPAYALCFGDDSPLDGEFEAVATDVFHGYLEHAEVAQ